VVPCADAQAVVVQAQAAGVRAGAVGSRVLRLVTHLGVSSEDIGRAAAVLAPLVISA